MLFFEVSLIDLYMFTFAFVFLLTFIIWNVTFLLGDSNSKFYHKSFNCGFDIDQYTQSINTNIRFFVVGLLFLIFDVELVLMLPLVLGASTKNSFDIESFYVFFVLLTLLMVIETSKDFLSLI